jgi:hypothetical protein
VTKRAKKASKGRRGDYGHTPLTAEENLPWGGERLIVGTGAYGALPITPEVYRRAAERGIEVAAVPTEEALRLLADVDAKNLYAVIHITC